jgi:hypothetical protein
MKTPTSHVNSTLQENCGSEVRDQVHSLKKLGVSKNVSGKIVTPNFNNNSVQ